MKASRKRRRRLVRALAIAGSVTALAAPVGAGAMPIDTHAPQGVQSYAQAPDESGARLDHRGLNDVQSVPSSIIREVRDVGHDGNRTLAIVLASSALGIALCGSGYAALRLTRIQRRLGVSS